jgi:ribosomal protein L37AE/L43A
MGGAISVAAVLAARHIKVTCPSCGHVHRASRSPLAYRMCPRCRRLFADPHKRRR